VNGLSRLSHVGCSIFWSGSFRYVQSSRSGIVSLDSCPTFRGTERRSFSPTLPQMTSLVRHRLSSESPITPLRGFCRLALHVPIFRRIPGPVLGPARRVLPFQDSRHRQALKEPNESFTRSTPEGILVHQSRLRDLHESNIDHMRTTFDHHGSLHFGRISKHSPSLSRSPKLQRLENPWDRIWRLVLKINFRGLLPKAPLEPDEHLSMTSGSTRQRQWRLISSAHPYNLVGSQVYERLCSNWCCVK